jgi:type II secretory pathway pseudopilin PulG
VWGAAAFSDPNEWALPDRGPTESARGLAHSKTLRAFDASPEFAPAFWTAAVLRRYRAPCGRLGFTMIEIAIALGVIGFALVAIIGILPAGLNVQKEAHQDSIISQDGPFFLEAIRNGGLVNDTNRYGLAVGTNRIVTSLDFLTNYIDYITITTNGTTNGITYSTTVNGGLLNGQQILGLLSTPEYYYTPFSATPSHQCYQTNFVYARVRGLSGPAMEQNGSNSMVAFRYYMFVEVDPYDYFSVDSYDFNAYSNNPTGIDYLTRLTRARQEPYIFDNLYEVRLKFMWPVSSVGGQAGPGRQTFRCIVSGQLQSYTNSRVAYWFFQPNSYTNNTSL